MSADPQLNRPEPPRAPPIDPARVAARVLPMRRAMLHELRWRAPDVNWRRVAVAILVAILAHLLLIWLVRDAMRAKPFVENRRDVIQVSLIEVAPPQDLPAAVHELPPLSVSSPQGGTARNAPAPLRRERGQRPVAAPAAAAEGVDAIVATPSAPSLYNADGSLRLAPAPQEPAQPRAPIEQGKLAAQELLKRGHNVVRCKSTRFARAYAPDESLGETAARKYGRYVGLYNPATAKKAAERAMETQESCDWQD
ncbi:hypothetical protein DFR29_110150 [Tahibacter aquaticus]|uniref:Uncharacterized protein n=1 Tax=Tahibacter aquaticus TaxID=520092 RepID=A0A4R6YTE1_9GAMM|nr:hypothetical protein [Tahibacter aquaticus]TDR41667.1 hypothetical protein DFR29_110150 [Tahibacter aquaticus]